MMKSEVILPPSAAGLSASLRGMGYSLEMAIADLVDNSISAKATDVVIETPLPEDNLNFLLIADNGTGMSRQELINALRLGSISPNVQRQTDDLGRFGMGLKSASFSQCRRLTVCSKKDSLVNAFVWDLDDLENTNEWRLQEINPDLNQPQFRYINEFETGTTVIWEKIDKVYFDSVGNPKNQELKEASRVLRKHLSLTFHRFLEDGDFCLTLDGQAVKPWDPFFKLHPAKYFDFPEAYWPEDSLAPRVRLQAFVLPLPEHTPNKSSQLFSIDDDLKLQGFFIYRGKRLISYGGWLGLRNLETAEEFKLARIRLDFSNQDDHDWSLDIRKSIARPPREIREWLIRHANFARNKSKASLLNSSEFVSKQEDTSFWKKSYGLSPTIDWSNSFVSLIFETLDEKSLTPEMLRGFLEIIAVSHPSCVKKAAYQVPSVEMVMAIKQLYMLLSKQISPDDAKILMRSQAPFSSWKAVMNEVFEDVDNV